MRRPFSTITAVLLVIIALIQALRLWFGWPVTVDGMPIPTSASAAAIGIALALAIGLWFEARMHANLAYRNQEAAATRSGPTRATKQFTVLKGKRYRAVITLGFFEQIASNDTIAGMLADAGFADVVVNGSGGRRVAEALWAGDDATADMPAQIVSATEIEPPVEVAVVIPAVAAAAAPPPASDIPTTMVASVVPVIAPAPPTPLTPAPLTPAATPARSVPPPPRPGPAPRPSVPLMPPKPPPRGEG